VHVPVFVCRGPKIDNPARFVGEPLQPGIETRPAFGIDFTRQRALYVELAARTELERHKRFGAATDA